MENIINKIINIEEQAQAIMRDAQKLKKGLDSDINEKVGEMKTDIETRVNTKYETSVQGLYAVGDNIKNEYYQIITAMSAGTRAALNVATSLNEK